MREYKRLTERYVDKQGTNCVRKLTWDGEILHRLAELEDKIENGTLIEVPCKVGDTVYCIYHYYDGEEDFGYEIIPECVCLTKAEAEIKLKELQEKQK